MLPKLIYERANNFIPGRLDVCSLDAGNNFEPELPVCGKLNQHLLVQFPDQIALIGEQKHNYIIIRELVDFL